MRDRVIGWLAERYFFMGIPAAIAGAYTDLAIRYDRFRHNRKVGNK